MFNLQKKVIFMALLISMSGVVMSMMQGSFNKIPTPASDTQSVSSVATFKSNKANFSVSGLEQHITKYGETLGIDFASLKQKYKAGIIPLEDIQSLFFALEDVHNLTDGDIDYLNEVRAIILANPQGGWVAALTALRERIRERRRTPVPDAVNEGQAMPTERPLDAQVALLNMLEADNRETITGMATTVLAIIGEREVQHRQLIGVALQEREALNQQRMDALERIRMQGLLNRWQAGAAARQAALQEREALNQQRMGALERIRMQGLFNRWQVRVQQLVAARQVVPPPINAAPAGVVRRLQHYGATVTAQLPPQPTAAELEEQRGPCHCCAMM